MDRPLPRSRFDSGRPASSTTSRWADAGNRHRGGGVSVASSPAPEGFPMRRRTIAPLIGFVLLLALPGAAAAKGNALAELDAPIPVGAEPGSELFVGWRAWVPDVDGEWPFAGSPVFIRLISPDGSASTEVRGV